MMNIIQVLAIPMDQITLLFGQWNFAITGLTVIYWRGPLIVNQGYLVIVASLMAFVLAGLEQWTTWLLLGLLAVWGAHTIGYT